MSFQLIGATSTVTLAGTVGITGYPAAAVLANGTANPTLTAIETFETVYNGSTWDLQVSVQGVASSAGIGVQAVGAIPNNNANAAPSNATSTAYEASRVVKASAGTLYGYSGYNSGPGQFILLYNSTTVPADAAQAVHVWWVNANAPFSLDFGIYGRRFSTGIAWSNSSTAPTKTIGAANVFLDAQFV